MPNYSIYTEFELLKLLSNGDQQAFEALYSQHWADLYRSAFYILKDDAASKDIVQEIFVWLWDRRANLEIKNLKSYLKAAVRFKIANYIRSGQIRESFFVELAAFNSSVNFSSAEELIEVNELRTIIQQAIAELPAKCREIYLLKREEKLSNQEIAERLGISIKTVENQMTIALKRIRTAVEPYILSMLLSGAFYFS